MNLKTAKRIRKALAYRPHRHTQEYEPLQIHHLAKIPVFETHERTVTQWHPKLGKVSRFVTKIRMDATGRTPLRQRTESGEPQYELMPIAKPIRLKEGSPRRVYKLMKRLERTVGLDRVFEQLVQETGA